MFPGSTRTISDSKKDVISTQPSPKDWAVTAKVVTEARLEWAVDTFSPYKPQGVDGIYPALLQRGMSIGHVWFTVTYRMHSEKLRSSLYLSQNGKITPWLNPIDQVA